MAAHKFKVGQLVTPLFSDLAEAKDATMTEPITNANSRAIQAYRQMAERCREMAAISSRRARA
jgi:hypothetical protein